MVNQHGTFSYLLAGFLTHRREIHSIIIFNSHSYQGSFCHLPDLKHLKEPHFPGHNVPPISYTFFFWELVNICRKMSERGFREKDVKKEESGFMDSVPLSLGAPAPKPDRLDQILALLLKWLNLHS